MKRGTIRKRWYAWPKVPAADELHRRRRAAATVIERRSVEVKLDWLGEALRLGLADPYTGGPVGAQGALALGADALQVLPWIWRLDALARDN